MVHIRQGPSVVRSHATKPARDAALTPREQFGLTVLALERVRRRAVASFRRSRLLRWRYRAPQPHDLLISPTTLRIGDPSFANELALGSLGLAGAIAHCGGRSPFQIEPPTVAWARELHGFAWLRHLEAAGSQDAGAAARRLVSEWLRHGRRTKDFAWAPDVTGRRLISWLTHASMLLDGTGNRQHAAIMRSVADQRTYLGASWRNAADGYPRLIALIALVQADLGIAGHDRQLAQSENLLGAELDRQILSDGGHISRSPWVLVELLTDLLPLRRCFAACGVKPDVRITGGIRRMMAMLHSLRLGDGSLARFNGMGASSRGELMTVLDYADGNAQPDSATAAACPSGYVRLERGSSVIIVDAAPPPTLELAAHAHAGCLSFEMSSGRQLLFVNAGAPGASDAAHQAVARATASHNTLALQDQSSSKLIRDARLERLLGSPPLRHPDVVTCTVSEADGGGINLEASHDGYVDRFGLVHARSVVLEADGLKVTGHDALASPAGVMRFAWDIPFAIHFHLHPEVEARMATAIDAVDLILPGGECWSLAAMGAAISIEESRYLADPSGVRRSLQVALRGRSHGDSQVHWTITRVAAPAPPQAA